MAMDKQRARTARDKEHRRTVILKEARRALETHRVQDIAISGIAKAAGLGNATLYTYFEGKEDILLAVYEGEFRELIREMCVRLPSASDPSTASRTLVEAVVSRLVYRRLAIVLHTQLEPKVSETRRTAFREVLLEQLGKAGAALEVCLPLLPRGGGMAGLRRFHMLALGLHQFLDSEGKTIDGAVDFEKELHDALTSLLTGMLAKGAGQDE